MNTQPDFSFNRTLTNEELNFWSTFFDHCPFSEYGYIQEIISAFTKDSNFNLQEYSVKIKFLNSKEQLIELFDTSNFSSSCRLGYSKAINKLDKIFPNSKPLNLFFMTLYSGICQNMNFEFTPQGLNLLHNDRPTHVCELAFLADFMSERATQIFPHLNIKPIKLIGENTYEHKRSGARYILSIDGSLVNRTKDLNNKGTYEFGSEVSYDFSQNTREKLKIYAPLEEKQSQLIKLIEKNYLESTLEVNKTSYNKKIKI